MNGRTIEFHLGPVATFLVALALIAIGFAAGVGYARHAGEPESGVNFQPRQEGAT